MIDRPLECSSCKKTIAIQYTEIAGSNFIQSSMCAECPVLQRQIHGRTALTPAQELGKTAAGLCCGHCGTTLEGIRTGNPLGCSECYEVFGDLLLQDMISAGKLPTRLSAAAKKTTPLHHGRSPGEMTEMNPSLRLLALNEALNETLSREDYEQAAWLRDQIKALMEKQADERKK